MKAYISKDRLNLKRWQYYDAPDGTKWERDGVDSSYVMEGVWVTSFHKIGTVGNMETHQYMYFDDDWNCWE